MERVVIGGKAALEADELCPFGQAFEATDCYVDDGAVRGRDAYRSVAETEVAATGNPQHVGRFVVAADDVANIVVVDGEVFTVTDPTTEEESDGTITSVGIAFSDTANISGAQLGKNYYLGTDQADTSMRRMLEDYTLESLEAIPQGAQPSAASISPLAWTLFKDLASPTLSGAVEQTSANTGMSGLQTNWRSFTATNNGNDDPASGSTVLYNLGANFDARAYDWLVIAITPRDTNNSKGKVDVYVAEDSGGSPSNLTLVGGTYDVPPVGGSPNLLFCPLSGLASGSAGCRDTIRYIKFVLSGINGGKFGIYGYCFLPAPPLANPQSYYVTFYDSSTGQESKPTEALEVTITDTDKLNGGALVYPNCYLDNATFKNTGGNDDILSTANRRIFNREAGQAMPDLAKIGAIVTINGTTPASSTPDTVRLWKDTPATENGGGGRRLVGTASYPGASSAYSISDKLGTSVLENTKFRAGGTPPRCTALAAWAGRLIAGYENRVYISSFTPTSDNTNPYPQFPDVALEDADGWSFDIAPGADEQVLAIKAGPSDAVYILTNKACYSMSDLRPNSKPYLVLNRGLVSRQGAIYVENTIIWESTDGVYAAQGRAGWQELTAPIRRAYRDVFAPDSNACIGYKRRKLLIYRDNIMFRYDFTRDPKDGWTGPHTLAHNVRFAVSF